MKKYIYIFIFISSVYTLNQFKYKYKYNQEEYFDCCQYEKEVNFNRFSNIDLFGTMLYGVIKGQLDKEKKIEPSKPEYMEDIEYPEVRMINEISEIIKHNQ